MGFKGTRDYMAARKMQVNPVVWLASSVFLIFIEAQSIGQTAPSKARFIVTDAGPDFRIWERTNYEKSPTGRLTATKHKYVELATGMHYLKNGQWTESKET